MALNKNVFASLMLTMIMLLSIGPSPAIDWGSDNDDRTNDAEQSVIDYSQLEEHGLEDYNPNYALSQNRDFVVLRVDFSDEAASRNQADTITLFDQVADFFDESTYGGATLNFDVLPADGVPLNPVNRINADGTGDTTPTKASYGNFKGCTNNDDIMSDSIMAAVISGINLDQYDGLVLLHTGSNNGCSSGPNDYYAISSPDEAADFYDFEGGNDFDAFSWWEGTASPSMPSNDKSFTWLGEYWSSTESDTAVWGRWAHEIGHAVSLPHLAYDYAHCHDLMGSSCAYPVMPSSWTRALDSDPGLQSMDPLTDFTIVSNGVSTYSLTDLNDDPTSLPSGFSDQVLKIPISNDGALYYLVEARFDTLHDADLPISSEGVMIYRINEWSGYDPAEDLVWGDTGLGDAVSVMDASPGTALSNGAAWSAGQTFEDLSYGLEIEILSVDTAGHSAELQVTYNPTGAGPADIHISDWGQPPGEPGPWETIDIWVDSRLNNNDIDGVDNDGDGECDVDCDKDWDGMAADGVTYAQYYSDSVSGHSEIPLGRGDNPWIGHVNRFYVKISNTGETTLNNGMVKVKFQWRLPTAGGGLSDGWTTIGMIVCGDDAASISQETGVGDCLDFGDFPEESNENNELMNNKPLVAYIEWTPEESDFPDDSDVDASTEQTHKVHACIRVVVEPVGDEPTLENNDAQENLNYFETSPGSPYHPLTGTLTVGNPFNQDIKVLIQMNGLPTDWDSNLSWNGGELTAGQSLSVNWIVTPNDGYSLGSIDDVGFSMVIFKDDIDSTYSDHGHMYTLGGVTNRIATVERTIVDTTVNAIPGVINVVGSLDAYNPNSEARVFDSNSRVAIIVTSPNGIDYVVGTPTNSDGDFNININLLGLTEWVTLGLTGEWMVQVHYDGDSIHRSAFGEKNNVQVPPLSPDISIIDPIYTPTVSWGDDYLGSGTLLYPIYPETDIAVTYTSPSGEVISSSTSVDSSGSYSNTFSMNESGTWAVDYSYTDSDGVERSWSESVEVEEKKTPFVALFSTLSIVAMAAILTGRRQTKKSGDP